MNGKIFFDSPASLAAFLVAFTASTATFEVTEDRGTFVLKFTGGF